MPDDARVLTHCNAGALATAGYGTALGVIRGAVEAGKRVRVLADETRPFLQGSRLTAWELLKDGIDTTVITDNMAGTLMLAGEIDLVVVGADRIAANGDTANKIGTYTVAILAKEHGIPFYVAAPWSTIDLAIPDGSQIPIEERAAREVTHVGSNQLAPDGATIRNPAFDVTPHKYITAIITDRGVFTPPFDKSLKTGTSASLSRPLNGRPQSLRGIRAVVTISAVSAGIETSCDETAAAVVETVDDAARPWRAALEHRRLAGGDSPRVGRRRAGARVAAARARHLRRRRAGARRGGRRRGRGIDALAVTQGPGLIGSLLVGVSFAKTARVGRRQAARRRQSPRRPHRVALARARPRADAGGRARRVRRSHEPVSRAARQAIYRSIGRTRDDAAGEAYDKVAKLLGLGLSGRADHRSSRAARATNGAIRFPADAPDASRSQRAAARVSLRLQLQRSEDRGAAPRARSGRRSSASSSCRTTEIADIAASFQATVVDTLVERTFAAAKWYNARAVGIAGGVSANSRLRAAARARGVPRGDAGVRPEPASVDRQRRDDRRRRHSQVHRRGSAPADLNAAANLAL